MKLLAALLFAIAVTPRAEASGGVRRFALIAANDDGGPGRVRLRYASSDARSVSRVLGELGGISAGDQLMLENVTRASLLGGFTKMRAMLETARADRVELVFYYSGHSDDEGLLLAGERVGYAELRRAMELPADVRIAILDSCSSGALTRAKGGRFRPPFLADDSTRVRGHAFLTSSAEDEAALESDRVGASFFTHYLVSGLRGAADVSRDGRVTLNEVYQFAFDETLARTERTAGGAQHPTYDIQLAGSGDLVMTDVRSTPSGLLIPAGIEGRLFVRDHSGALVAEVKKSRGRVVELGVQPGAYEMLLDRDGRIFGANAVLEDGKRWALEDASLLMLDHETAIARGGSKDDAERELEEWSEEARKRIAAKKKASPPPAPPPPQTAIVECKECDPPRSGGYVFAPINVSFLPSLGTELAYGGPMLSAIELNILMGATDRLDGLALGFGLNWVKESARGVQIALGGNVVEEELRGLQLSLASNIVYRDLTGAQLTLGLNFAGHDVDVGQIALGANIALGRVRGLQASAFNLSSEHAGAQLGVLNVSTAVRGTQIGILNIGGNVKGLQLGLINVADDADVALGLFSFIKNGLFRGDLYASDTGWANASVRFGSRYFYTMFTAGIDPRGASPRWLAGIGWGIELPFREKFFLDLDVSANVVQAGLHFSEDETAALTRVRLFAGARILEHFAIFAGPTLNTMWTFRDGAAVTSFAPSYAHADDRLRVWPGFVLGIEI